jgi:hypothetical protein
MLFTDFLGQFTYPTYRMQEFTDFWGIVPSYHLSFPLDPIVIALII